MASGSAGQAPVLAAGAPSHGQNTQRVAIPEYHINYLLGNTEIRSRLQSGSVPQIFSAVGTSRRRKATDPRKLAGISRRNHVGGGVGPWFRDDYREEQFGYPREIRAPIAYSGKPRHPESTALVASYQALYRQQLNLLYEMIAGG